MREAQGFTRDTLTALSRSHNEPQWLLDRRLAAFEAWQAAPRPSQLDEDWRHTDVSDLDFASFGGLVAPNGASPVLPAAASEAAGAIAFTDGQSGDVRLDDDLRRRGVVLSSLRDALRTHGDLVQEAFMTRAVVPDGNPFTQLHAAFWTGGLFCYVPPGVEVDRPLLSAVGLSHGDVSALQHTLLVAGENSRVALVEEYAGGDGGRTLSVPVVEVLAGPGSQVSFSGLQAWSGPVHEFATRRVHLDRDAQASLTVGSLGGKLIKSFVGATLAGSGASCDLGGIYFPEAGQHFDYTTLQDHREPHGRSELLFKGALYDRAQSVFRGVVRVHPNAQQTDAYQTNNNLLLGHEARADSMPVLEIEADDVKCSHGATLAHLNDEDLFYLRTRGLDRELAQRMVIAGFFEPVIDRIPLASVREQLQDLVRRRIASH